MPVEKLLKSNMSEEQLSHYRSQLSKMGLDIARTLEKRYPKIKEIGVDVAVDNSLKPWILEVNTSPDPFIFKKLSNRAIFRKIYNYAAAYGRFNQKKRNS